jgi:[ribosomal protein S5]-alanine N-acetyltransferase
MHDLSKLILATPRLDIRPLMPVDAPALFAIYSDPEVMRYGSSPPWTEVQKASETIDEDCREALAGTSVRLGLFRRPDGALLGTCSLFHIDEQCRRAEIGYLLAHAAWGQGYATEAVGPVLAYAFRVMNLNRIEADIDPLNAPSARVLERQGFVKEGFLRERWIVAGQKSDSALYGLLAADFEAWQSARASISP